MTRLGAGHNAPKAAVGQADAIGFQLWRYADLLETCALTGRTWVLDPVDLNPRRARSGPAHL